jgi:hypothetical protein
MLPASIMAASRPEVLALTSMLRAWVVTLVPFSGGLQIAVAGCEHCQPLHEHALHRLERLVLLGVKRRPKERVRRDPAHEALRSIEEVWEELFPAEQSKIAHTLIERIIVRPDGVTINWRAGGIDALLRSALPAPEMMKEAA